jgi:prepilin-type N-terminal cleavage/methylation domain-containing protein
MPKSIARERAFSLVEVLVAMSVIGLCAAALLTGITSSVFTMRMVRENQRATQILLEKVETLRLYNWDQINRASFFPGSFEFTLDATNTGIYCPFTAKYDPNATDGEGGTYQGYLWIIPASYHLNTSYRSEMKAVYLGLYWQTGRVNRYRYLSTYVTRNGLQNYVYGWDNP